MIVNIFLFASDLNTFFSAAAQCNFNFIFTLVTREIVDLRKKMQATVVSIDCQVYLIFFLYFLFQKKKKVHSALLI